jgi:hypothetical protein
MTNTGQNLESSISMHGCIAVLFSCRRMRTVISYEQRYMYLSLFELAMECDLAPTFVVCSTHHSKHANVASAANIETWIPAYEVCS